MSSLVVIEDVIKNLGTATVSVSNIELKDGRTTQIVTFYNNDAISFEDVKLGEYEILANTENAQSVSTDIYNIKNRVITKNGIHYPKKKVEHRIYLRY